MLGAGIPFLTWRVLILHSGPIGTTCHSLGVVITTCCCAGKCLIKTCQVCRDAHSPASSQMGLGISICCPALHCSITQFQTWACCKRSRRTQECSSTRVRASSAWLQSSTDQKESARATPCRAQPGHGLQNGAEGVDLLLHAGLHRPACARVCMCCAHVLLRLRPQSHGPLLHAGTERGQ